MSDYINNLRNKLRFNSPMRILLDGLRHIGLTFMPFYIFNEDVKAGMSANTLSLPKNFEFCHLTDQDMPELELLPMRTRKAGSLLKLMEDGNRCLAIRIHGQIAAFSWFNTHECNFSGAQFPLGASEAYLFDTYTSPDFRGQNLAPLVRQEIYKVLYALGISKALSVSECFNRPAIRFKSKLGATKKSLLLFVSLKKFNITLPIKQYEAEVTNP